MREPIMAVQYSSMIICINLHNRFSHHLFCISPTCLCTTSDSSCKAFLGCQIFKKYVWPWGKLWKTHWPSCSAKGKLCFRWGRKASHKSAGLRLLNCNSKSASLNIETCQRSKHVKHVWACLSHVFFPKKGQCQFIQKNLGKTSPIFIPKGFPQLTRTCGPKPAMAWISCRPPALLSMVSPGHRWHGDVLGKQGELSAGWDWFQHVWTTELQWTLAASPSLANLAAFTTAHASHP